MKVEHYLNRAEKEIANVASHHDTPADIVAAALKHLMVCIEQQLAGMPAARRAYGEMQQREVNQRLALRTEALIRDK